MRYFLHVVLNESTSTQKINEGTIVNYMVPEQIKNNFRTIKCYIDTDVVIFKEGGVGHLKHLYPASFFVCSDQELKDGDKVLHSPTNLIGTIKFYSSESTVYLSNYGDVVISDCQKICYSQDTLQYITVKKVINYKLLDIKFLNSILPLKLSSNIEIVKAIGELY